MKHEEELIKKCHTGRQSGHTGSQTGPKKDHTTTYQKNGESRKNLPARLFRVKRGGGEKEAHPALHTIRNSQTTEGKAHPAPQPGVRLRPLRFDSGDPPAPKPTGIRVHPEYTGGVGAPLGPPYPKAPLPVLMGKWEFSPRSQGQAPRKR